MFLAATTRACQRYRSRIRKRRRSTRGAAQKRAAASSLPMSRLCSASTVEHRAAKHSNSASNFLFSFPSTFRSRHLSFFPARTQLVSTKHGVTRTRPIRTSRLFLVRAPKKHISILQQQQQLLRRTTTSIRNPTSGALRYANNQQTHHSLATTRQKRARFTFLSISDLTSVYFGMIFLTFFPFFSERQKLSGCYKLFFH